MPGNDHADGPARAPLREHTTEDVIVPATPAQAAYLADLKRRASECVTDNASADRRRSKGISIDAPPYIIAVLPDERMANMDLRLARQPMDGPGKIAAAAARIAREARRTRGLQVVFCEIDLYRDHQEIMDPDVPVPPSWDIQALLTEQLTARRIAASRIRFAVRPDIERRGAAEELDAACRDGTVRVLVSTTTAIAHVPAATDLVAGVHHLDVPLDSADAELRDAVLAREDAPALREFRYMTSGYTEADGWYALSQGRGPVWAAQEALTGVFSVATTQPPEVSAPHRPRPQRPPEGTRAGRKDARRSFPK